jgi:hypothetical protein
MPDAEPYRAWQAFTFTADRGHVREVDLFIATPGGLFLVEIKSHPGTPANEGSTWMFRDGDKSRPVENPLHFTDQKAKELKSQVARAASKLHVREPLPRVYGRDKLEQSTGLNGIWTGLGPQGPGHRPDRPDRRPQHHRRLGHRPPDPPASRPPGNHALGPPAARRDRPGLRPEPCRGLPHHRTRVPQPNRRRPPRLDPATAPTRPPAVGVRNPRRPTTSEMVRQP